MTILLKKDGQLIIDADQPIEGVSLDNLAAILAGANDGDVIQYDVTNGMWVNKSAPSSLPEVTASDKGKYLKANETTGDPEWASGGSSGGGVLVVHSSDDDTSVLDKTWQEIHDAMLQGGAVIVFEDGSAYTVTVAKNDMFMGVIVIAGSNPSIKYVASSTSGYPVLSD